MTITCEVAQLGLLEPPVDPQLARHVEGCAECQAFARDLALVSSSSSLPEPSPAELDGLVASTWAEWRRFERSRRSWLGYAAAAGLGALLASAGFWTVRPVREVVVEKVVEAPPVRLASSDEPNLGSDEVFFEVMWPDLPEGETP